MTESFPGDSAGSRPFSNRLRWIAVGILVSLIVLAFFLPDFDPEPREEGAWIPDKPRIGQSPQPDPEIYRLLAGTEPGQVRDDNNLTMKLVWCPPGEFMMGSPKGEGAEDEHAADGQPAHLTLTHGFWLGQFEVTQSEWTAVMGTQPWSQDEVSQEGADFPATFVTQADAVAFCKKLTTQEFEARRLSAGWKYTLPTEAQWEYACRAGTDGRYSFGDDRSRLNEYSWCDAFGDEAVARDDGYSVHRVGQKLPNAWGFFDMYGNVGEWCRDQFAKVLPGGTDPEIISGEGFDGVIAGIMLVDEPRIGEKRWTFRGGGISHDANRCRSACRFAAFRDRSEFDLGFRVSLCPGR